MTDGHEFDVDLDTISELRDLTPPSIFDELIDLYLTDSRRRLGDIKNALASGDLEALSEAAHGLKGSSLSIGISSVAEIAGELERAARAGEMQGIDILVSRVEQRFLGMTGVLDGIRDEETHRNVP